MVDGKFVRPFHSLREPGIVRFVITVCNNRDLFFRHMEAVYIVRRQMGFDRYAFICQMQQGIFQRKQKPVPWPCVIKGLSRVRRPRVPVIRHPREPVPPLQTGPHQMGAVRVRCGINRLKQTDI